jgi:hypothetical protein
MTAGMIRNTLRAWGEVWTRKRALGATSEFLRVFLVCTVCHRVVPYYAIVGPRGRDRRCRCGNGLVRPAAPAYWTGAAWVLGCLVWRKWIRGRGEGWDPRAPIRAAELG